MSENNQGIAALIVDFLQSKITKSEIPDDSRESIEFAIESINEAFSLEDVSSIIKTNFNNKSLVELIKLGSAASTEESTNKTASDSKEIPVHIDQVDADIKEKAEAFKLEGNRAMARKDYDEAISKYTEALNLIPNHAVFLSNRAAAYSSIKKHEEAIRDADAAIESDKTYAKAYSRKGLALYALGDAEGAMKAYGEGLKVEGSSPSDAMKRGFETAKKRVADKIASSLSNDSATKETESEASSTENNGLPDLSSLASMLGGGAGGAGGLGGLAGLMNNPQLMQAAQGMMQNPEAMNNVLNNPQLRQMAQGLGENANLEDLMNNPMLRNLANQFMGGQNRG